MALRKKAVQEETKPNFLIKEYDENPIRTVVSIVILLIGLAFVYAIVTRDVNLGVTHGDTSVIYDSRPVSATNSTDQQSKGH